MSSYLNAISTGAFGLGALEDPDEDDMDVFTLAPDSNQNRKISLRDDDDRLGPELLSANKSRERERRQVLRPTQDRLESFNDGTPIIAGFRLASKTQTADKW
jgi:hypothetical protein